MKIVCIYDDKDLDGIMSAAIVKHWFEKTFTAIDTLDFITFNSEKLSSDLSKYNSIINCHIPNTSRAICEYIWHTYFNTSIPEILRLLALYYSNKHIGTNEEQKVIEFHYGALSCINNYEQAYSYLMMSLEHIPYEQRIEEEIQTKGKGIYDYLTKIKTNG